MTDYLRLLPALAAGIAASAVLTYLLIPFLRKQAGQNIREDGPQAHLKKAGTPSMGGIAIIAGAMIGVIAALGYTPETVIIGVGFVGFGLIGFWDDYLKVIKKQNEGLTAPQKFGAQFLLAAALACCMYFFFDAGSKVYVPFAHVYTDLGWAYIPFLIFTIVAMVNAVNLNDGLDGLASGVTSIVCVFMAVIAVKFFATTSAIYYAAILGACLGFLIFNHHPAKIFMGDTGSLALGGGITMAAVAFRMELILPIIGLMYVLEVVSVILQVLYFKATHGKRLFRMSPLHHHFELCGLKETKVVLLFCGVTLLCGVISLLAVL